MKTFYYPIISFVVGWVIMFGAFRENSIFFTFLSMFFLIVIPLGLIIIAIISKDKWYIISSVTALVVSIVIILYYLSMLNTGGTDFSNRCQLQGSLRCSEGYVEVHDDGTFTMEIQAGQDLRVSSFEFDNINCTTYEDFVMNVTEKREFTFDCGFEPGFSVRRVEDFTIRYRTSSNLEKTISGRISQLRGDR